jgi:hypothetical protein
MTLAQEFRSYAADCDRMVNYTRDLESKAIWKRMAARWRRAAELEEQVRGNIVTLRCDTGNLPSAGLR